MNRNINHITLVVKDYDESIHYYTKMLEFEVVEDTKINDKKRWVILKPKGKSNFSLLIAKAANKEQLKSIGNQTGGRVFLFMNTDNFDRDFELFNKNGVEFVRQPIEEPYGKVAVFKDLYGNLWDLIEPRKVQETHYYTTAILELKNNVDRDKALIALKKLEINSKNESGNVLYEIQQLKDVPDSFIVWECFKNENHFQKHLQTTHFKEFIKSDIFNFKKGYSADKI